jgi:hypothetical protein
MGLRKRVLSLHSPTVLTPPIPQWGPYVPLGGAPVQRHPLHLKLAWSGE